MSNKPKFDLTDIPRYLWNGPARIRQTLAEQGPTAASRAARYYSLALCLTVFAIYLLMWCVLGFFQVATMAGGMLILSDPRVLFFVIIEGLVLLAAVLAALWAAGLGVLAVSNPQEERGKSVSALLWGIALVIFYVGFGMGLLGYGR